MEESQTEVEEEEEEVKPKLKHFKAYKSLCKDGSNLTESYKSQLFCRFSRMRNPYLTLMPVKEEIVYLSPRVALYHDVISDGEIGELKRLTEKNMSASRVINQNSKGYNIWSPRVSKVAWLEHNATSTTKRVINRVGDITGLGTKDAERLQMANYGIGGHFVPHKDPYGFITDDWKHSGDRIATWLFYFSDVTSGGGTVFIDLEVAVSPVKGSALFWYNLHRNGTTDEKSLHAGCPVLVGNKWAGNLWIHEYEQTFNRPCSLNEDE